MSAVAGGRDTAPAPCVLVVIGTRPEGIKLAPVIGALARHSGIDTRVALTGQHGPLMQQVIDAFDIPVHHDLGIMKEGQDLYDVTTACLTGLRDIVRSEEPDLIVVEGDTASVFVAGLVGFYERTPVAHVEAGLRSGDKWRPWPEEGLRRLTGVVADIHFAPTDKARRNLEAEGVPPGSIHVTGNTVVDALLAIARRHTGADTDRSGTGGGHSAGAALESAIATGKRLVLVTAHRRESFGAPLRAALGALRTLADRIDDIHILYPVHPNPNVRLAAHEILAGHERVTLCEPLDYHDLVHALDEAVLVITDSGGLQEEAPTLRTPVLVMRDVTERPEAVESGAAALVGTDPEIIVACATAVLGSAGWSFLRALRQRQVEAIRATGGEEMAPRVPTAEEVAAAADTRPTDTSTYPNPYGDGRAGERIADIIASRLTGTARETEDWPGPQ